MSEGMPWYEVWIWDPKHNTYMYCHTIPSLDAWAATPHSAWEGIDDFFITQKR